MKLKRKVTRKGNQKSNTRAKITNERLHENIQKDIASFLDQILNIEEVGFSIKPIGEDICYVSKIAKEYLNIHNRSNYISQEELVHNIVPAEKKKMLSTLNSDTISSKTNSLQFHTSPVDKDSKESKLISAKFNIYNKYLIATLNDITGQDKIKKDITKAREKAEESDRLKNIFLANISREIRIPINSIVGFAELLKIGNLTNDTRKLYIEVIKNQSYHLLKIIDDISEMARLDAGQIKITKSPCNINLLLNELLLNFNQQKSILNKENIELTLNLPEEKNIVILTDPGRIQQILSNLLNNALQWIEKGNIEFGYGLKDENIVEFYVKDTGPGLSKEEQQQIFDRFKFEEETIARKYEGTGLGLTIAKQIIRLLGGKIWVESEKNIGSTFIFQIPYERVSNTEKEKVEPESSIANNFKWKDRIILVVEDDDVNYKFMETLLIDTNAKLIRANNGIQALELFKSMPKIDLILMDIKMPDMDGFEATKRLREIDKNVPIIAQTAFALEHDREKCLEVGCDDQIAKPIEIKELLELLNKYLT